MNTSSHLCVVSYTKLVVSLFHRHSIKQQYNMIYYDVFARISDCPKMMVSSSRQALTDFYSTMTRKLLVSVLPI